MNDPATQQLQEELALIKKMISASRRVRAESGDIYLVVGLMLLLAGIVDISVATPMSWIAWPISGALGWAYALISGLRRAHTTKHVSYAPRVEGVAWTVTCMAAAALAGMYIPTGSLSPDVLFPLMGLLLSIPLAVSGALYRYWPLSAGAAVFLVSGVVGIWLPPNARGPLFLVSMTLGYIAPGIAMLRMSQRPDGSA
ncbi:MAG: hypothetical protein ACPG4T_09930 [Nannocystaceae bacterium]